VSEQESLVFGCTTVGDLPRFAVEQHAFVEAGGGPGTAGGFWN